MVVECNRLFMMGAAKFVLSILWPKARTSIFIVDKEGPGLRNATKNIKILKKYAFSKIKFNFGKPQTFGPSAQRKLPWMV